MKAELNLSPKGEEGVLKRKVGGGMESFHTDRQAYGAHLEETNLQPFPLFSLSLSPRSPTVSAARSCKAVAHPTLKNSQRAKPMFKNCPEL